MSSYTPLDINKLKSQYTRTPIAPDDIGVNSKQRHSPFLTIVVLAITFFGTLLYLSMLARQPNIQKTEAKQEIPPKKIIKLLAGTDATFPPMESIDANKEIVGYDVELGQKIANEMNVNIEFVNVPWDQVFTYLEQRKIDLIISSVSITEERKLKYIYSDPYLNAGQVVITRKTDNTIKSPHDLTGKKVGVQKGTTNEQEAMKYTDTKHLLPFVDFQVEVKALVSGQVDAIFSDLPGAKGVVTEYPQLKIASDPFTDEYYGILFRKDEIELRDNINKALTSLRQKGILNNLKEKYLD